MADWLYGQQRVVYTARHRCSSGWDCSHFCW